MLKTMLRKPGEIGNAMALTAAIFTIAAFGGAKANESSATAGAAMGWSVSRSTDIGPVMARSRGPVTVDLRIVTDEYNMFTPTLELKVVGCGGKDWTVSDSASPVGDSVADRGARVREVAVQQFVKARHACPVSAEIEAELLDGFEAAYAQFESIRQ